MDAQLTTYLQSMQAQGHAWESVKQLLVQSGYTPEQLQAAETFYLTGQVPSSVTETIQPVSGVKPASSKIAVLVIVIGLGALIAVGAGAFYLKSQTSQPAVVVDTSTTVEEETNPQVDTQVYTKPLPQVDVMAFATNPNALLDAVRQSLKEVTAYQYTFTVTNDENQVALDPDSPPRTLFSIKLDVKVDQSSEDIKIASKGETHYFKAGEAKNPENVERFENYMHGDRYIVRLGSIPGVAENQMILPPNVWIDTAQMPQEYMVMGDPSLVFKGFDPLNFDRDKLVSTDLSGLTQGETRMIDGVECVKVLFSIDGTEDWDTAPDVTYDYTMWIGKEDALPRELVEVTTARYAEIADVSRNTTLFTAYNQPPQIEEPSDVKQLSDLKRSE